jgi:hypothetical protein
LHSKEIRGVTGLWEVGVGPIADSRECGNDPLGPWGPKGPGGDCQGGGTGPSGPVVRRGMNAATLGIGPSGPHGTKGLVRVLPDRKD